MLVTDDRWWAEFSLKLFFTHLHLEIKHLTVRLSLLSRSVFSVPQLCVFERSPILILPWVVPCNLRKEKGNINFPFLPGRLGVLNRCFFKWGFECVVQQCHASEAKTHLVSAKYHQTSGANSEMCLAQLHPLLWSFLRMFVFLVILVSFICLSWPLNSWSRFLQFYLG